MAFSGKERRIKQKNLWGELENMNSVEAECIGSGGGKLQLFSSTQSAAAKGKITQNHRNI